MLRFILPAFLSVVFVFLNPSALLAQKTVLIDAFENQSDDRTLDWLSEGLAVAIADRLSAQPEVYVFGLDERRGEYDRIGIPETVSVSRATALRLAWDIGADVLVTGKFSGTHGDFAIDARIVDLVADNAAFDFSISGRLDEVLPMAASLASQVSGSLVPGSVLPESDYARRPPVPRSAFEAYVRGVITTEPDRKAAYLSDAIRLYPQYPAALYQLGQVYYLDSNYKESIEMLERVPRDVPEYPLAQFMVGVNYYHLEEFSRAAQVFAALPPVYDVLVNLGAALNNSGDAAGATFAWRRALEEAPQGAEAAFNLGFLSFRNNEFEIAASRLAQFLDSHARDAEAMYLLGRSYERLNRDDEARRLLVRAVRLSPRLERMAGPNVPNLVRIKVQFEPTALRIPPGMSFWTSPRLARRDAALEATNALREPKP